MEFRLAMVEASEAEENDDMAGYEEACEKARALPGFPVDFENGDQMEIVTVVPTKVHVEVRH